MTTKAQRQKINRRYYAKNKKRLTAAALARYHKNGDRLTPAERRAYNRKYRVENPEKCVKSEPSKRKALITRKKKYAENPEFRRAVIERCKRWWKKSRSVWWARNLRRKYGITPDQHKALFESQHGRCAICGCSETKDPHHFPVVDHCHKTNKIRGLLCRKCNHGIGLFGDSPKTLMNAAAYLERGLTM